MKTINLLISAAAIVAGTVATTQESVRSKTPTPARDTNPLDNIGEIEVSSRFEVEGKTSEDAPTTKELTQAVVDELDTEVLMGTLPARIEVRMNAFKSKVTGDTIYAIQYEVIRPTVILGTTEVIETPVWHVSGIGRVNSSVESAILEVVKDFTTKLNGEISKTIPKSR